MSDLKPIKLLEKSTGSNFLDTSYSNIFLDMCPEEREIKAKINYWDVITISSFCTATCKRMKIHHFLRPYTKINSKWIKGLNVRPKTIKILEESIGSNFCDTGHSNILPDHSPEARETKEKINYWDYTKIKSFCTAKEAINETKRQPLEWEKTFANDIS